jgi:NTP pyrophosphatase (non-canonical NTP hydrolase)
MKILVDEKILAAVINKWGSQSQLDMVVGEFGELLTLYGRKAQNRDSQSEWLSEIADCYIMLSQLAFMNGISQNELQAEIEGKQVRVLTKL